MRLGGERESDNVEDQRGGGSIGRGGLAIGGGLGTLAIAVIALLFGIDPTQLLNGGGGQPSGPGPGAPTRQAPQQDDEMAQFVRRVLGSTPTTCGGRFRRSGPPPPG